MPKTRDGERSAAAPPAEEAVYQSWLPGVTRREFFTTVGAGTVVAATSCKSGPEARPDTMPPTAAERGERGAAGDAMTRVRLKINGQEHQLLVEPRWTLLHVLREELGLTATKVGCERGECGACTVLVGDVPRYACMMLAVEAEDEPITTLEGLMRGEELGPTQQAFLEEDALQCGYCTPGQIMAVEGLLRATPEPALDEVRRGVSGNLCRCGAYVHIFNAARRASQLKAGEGR